RKALKELQVDVDNPARKKGKKPESPDPSPKGEGSEEHPGPVAG
ncbi:MAG: DNA-binding protein, partial [Prevotella sp.]|nr:DNA-binding protein [Prevotella sp.]